SGETTILFGQGDGRFGGPGLRANSVPVAAVADDFNGDGIPDLAVSNGIANVADVLLGLGDGSFQHPSRLATGDKPVALASADFNGDGKRDLAVANAGSADVTFLIGRGAGIFVSGYSIHCSVCST